MSLAVIRRLKNYIRLHKDFFRRKGQKYLKAEIQQITALPNDQIRLSGTITANVPIEGSHFRVSKFRDENISFGIPISLLDVRRPILTAHLNKLTGYKRVGFEAIIDVDWEVLPSSQYNFTYATKHTTGAFIYKKNKHLLQPLLKTPSTIHLFFDEKSKGFRIEKLAITGEQIEHLTHYAEHPIQSGKVNCIIGEYTLSARDNGYALFEAIRKTGINEDSRINSYYPIEKCNQDSIEINNRDIIEWGSFDHVKKCIDAHVVAFTHDKINVYPQVLKVIAKKQYVSVKTFFLQHGVTALKRSSEIHYNKKRTNVSLVNTCSEWERDIFIKYFGFEPSEVVVGGFPRHDRLFRMNEQSNREPDIILIFPTWRSGLARLSDEEFKKSKYFMEWASLSNRIRTIKRNGIPLRTIFMMHPMLQHLSHLMKIHADEIHFASDFQPCLMRSSALVTDYSSICFEALYAQRDTFFFMFDAKEYRIREDAYLDIETELFGPVAFNQDQMIQDIAKWAAGKNISADSDAKKYPEYFSNIDDKNCLRIADSIVRISTSEPSQNFHNSLTEHDNANYESKHTYN